MHTAICAFEDKVRAEQAIDSLVRAGFARHDLHIQHKQLAGQGEDANDRWDALEREIAVDPGVVTAFGRFFARLFGRDHVKGHVDTYTSSEAITSSWSMPGTRLKPNAPARCCRACSRAT
jgi:hypothetical protein